MKEITLGGGEVHVLAINIGEKQYKIPLGGSMPYKKLKAIKTSDDIYGFLAEHIPEKVLDTLTVADITTIFNAWSEATKEDTGATPGESSASRS